ncbi:MAG: hypothetical protein M3173_09385 [Chloroflexota bacterium]|nr:hypothetical protein [Chloroflexota bacterium]
MLQVHDGQCGMCAHFGETNMQDRPKLIQIRTTHEAPDDLVEPCGLPDHAEHNLMVTPDSGCAAFTPAEDEARPNA